MTSEDSGDCGRWRCPAGSCRRRNRLAAAEGACGVTQCFLSDEARSSLFSDYGPQDWRPDVLRCETVLDANGRELVRETTHDGESIAYELLDRVPPKSIKRRIATDNLPYSGTWTFSLQPNGELTIVRLTENGEVHNPVFRFISRFILGHTRTMDAYLRALGKSTGQEVEVKD